MATPEPTVPALWAALSPEDRRVCLGICMPSMRRAPLLLRLRDRARRGDLANRAVCGPHAAGLAWGRWLYQTKRIDG